MTKGNLGEGMRLFDLKAATIKPMSKTQASTALTTTTRPTTSRLPTTTPTSNTSLPSLVNNEVEIGFDDSELLACGFERIGDKECSVR